MELFHARPSNAEPTQVILREFLLELASIKASINVGKRATLPARVCTEKIWYIDFLFP